METQLYRPTTGTEGEIFQELWCHRCSKDTEAEPCQILDWTMVLAIDHPDYPKEWVWGDDDVPQCTAFSAATGAGPGSREEA